MRKQVFNLGPRTGEQPVGLLFQRVQLAPRLGFDGGEQGCTFLGQRLGLGFAAIGAVAQQAFFLAVQAVVESLAVMHARGAASNTVGGTAVGINADVRLVRLCRILRFAQDRCCATSCARLWRAGHAKVPLAVFVCAAHLGVARLVFVLGAGRGVNDGGVHDGAALEDEPALAQVGVDLGKQGVGELVGFQQTAKVENGGFVRDGTIEQADLRKAAQGLDVVQGFFHAGVGVAKPVLQHVHPQHHRQRLGRTPAFAAGLGVVRLNDRLKTRKRHDSFHFGKKALFLGDLALGQIVEVGKADLLHGRFELWVLRNFTVYRCRIMGASRRAREGVFQSFLNYKYCTIQ